jgi:hypothetical protein
MPADAIIIMDVRLIIFHTLHYFMTGFPLMTPSSFTSSSTGKEKSIEETCLLTKTESHREILRRAKFPVHILYPRIAHD